MGNKKTSSGVPEQALYVQEAVFTAANVSSLGELKDKEQWGDSYDFLVSLQNDDQNIQNYSKNP